MPRLPLQYFADLQQSQTTNNFVQLEFRFDCTNKIDMMIPQFWEQFNELINSLNSTALFSQLQVQQTIDSKDEQLQQSHNSRTISADYRVW